MMLLLVSLAAAYITVSAIAVIGFGQLMRRTSGNVSAVLRAEEWRLSRAARLAPSSPSVTEAAAERALIGAGPR